MFTRDIWGNTLLDDLINGVRYRYPPCCVIAFLCARAFITPHYTALILGGRTNRRGARHVPCGVFHHPDDLFDDRYARGFVPEEAA